MGNLSQIVPFSSNFSPISNQFHTFLLHFLECIYGNSHNSPFPSILPPLFHFLHFSKPLRLVS